MIEMKNEECNSKMKRKIVEIINLEVSSLTFVCLLVKRRIKCYV